MKQIRYFALIGLALSMIACSQPVTSTQGEREMADVVQQEDTTTQADTTQAEESLSLPETIDVHQTVNVRERDDVLLIDVREQWEYDEAHIPGITLIPMGSIASRLQEIPTDKTVILTCRSGNRSGKVTDFLREQGYTNVHNMSGGILAWQQAGYAVE